MASMVSARVLLFLSMALLAGCESLLEGAFQQEPLVAGKDWERARQVGNAPSNTVRDPAVARLTPLAKKDPEETLQQLVDALVAGRRDGFEKVRAIHDWITKNISYDFPAFLGKAPTIVEPFAVIRHGSSVCQGYSNLFTQMCTMAGIESQVVVGYGRGYGYDPFSEDNQPYQSNHAWNAVLINGGWYLVDTTWDAGGLEGQQTGFTFKWHYSTGFLFTPPDIFLCTHFPDDPRWQLLDQPLNLAQLRAQPPLWGDFGTLGFSMARSVQRVTSVGEEQELMVRVPPNTRLLGTARQVFRSCTTGTCECPSRTDRERTSRTGPECRATARAMMPWSHSPEPASTW
jgi:transglutaminase/protease-like cytokinesis protein 3